MDETSPGITSPAIQSERVNGDLWVISQTKSPRGKVVMDVEMSPEHSMKLTTSPVTNRASPSKSSDKVPSRRSLRRSSKSSSPDKSSKSQRVLRSSRDKSESSRKRPPELDESSPDNPGLRKTPPELLLKSKKRPQPLFTSNTVVEDILQPTKKVKIVAEVQKIRPNPPTQKPQTAVVSKKNNAVEVNERRVSTREKRQTEFLGRTTGNVSTSTKMVVPVAGSTVSNEHLVDIYKGLTTTETSKIDDAIKFIIKEGATLTPANINRVFLSNKEPAMSANSILSCIRYRYDGKSRSRNDI